MMKILSGLFVIVALAFVSMGVGPCQSVNIGSEASKVWNDPAVQAEIQKAEQIAADYAKQWITSHLGASRKALKSSSAQSAMSSAESAVHAQCPNLPPSVVHDIVAAKFAGD